MFVYLQGKKTTTAGLFTPLGTQSTPDRNDQVKLAHEHQFDPQNNHMEFQALPQAKALARAITLTAQNR